MTGIAEEKYLCEQLSYDEDFVILVGNRLRKNGIWGGKKVQPDWKSAIEDDAMRFFIAVNVALGNLKVHGDPKDPKLSLTDSGMEKGKKLIKGAA